MVMVMDMVTDMDMVMVMDMDTMDLAIVIMDSDTMVCTNVQLNHLTDIPIMVTAMDTMHAPTDTTDMVTPMSLSAVTIKLFSLKYVIFCNVYQR